MGCTATFYSLVVSVPQSFGIVVISAFAFEWSVPSSKGGRFRAHSSISRIHEAELSTPPLRKLLFAQLENKTCAW